MARTLFWLFLLIWSDANAWYCTYTPDSNGYMDEESLACYDIEEEIAIRDYWCVSYQPEDPICNAYSTCVDQTEQRTTTCTEPNTNGFVNESRFYTCNSQSWSDWIVSSSHCTPDPATCIEAVEERTVECEPGYHGLSVEQRHTTCSTPYSIPTVLPWTTISSSCTLKASDPTSIESPLNPASPLNTTVPLSTPVQTPATEPVTASQDPVQQEMEMPTVETETEEKVEQETQVPETKENEEVVPGFGIAIKLIQQSNNALYEQPTEIFLGQNQDDYAQDQNFLFDFIQSDDIGDRFDSIARHRWYQLHGDNPLQRYGFSD